MLKKYTLYLFYNESAKIGIKNFPPAYHNGIRKIQYIENYADLDSRLLTSLVSTRIRPCACAGASTLRHAYVAPCMHHVSLCGREGEGEEGEKERQDTDWNRARSGPCYWQAVFYRYVHRNSSAILPPTPYGTPFSAARRRQFDIRYRALPSFSPFISHRGPFIFFSAWPLTDKSCAPWVFSSWIYRIL